MRREESIGWFKFISIAVTLQHEAKKYVENHLKSVHFKSDEVKRLTFQMKTTNKNSANKKKSTNHDDNNDKWKEIIFPIYFNHQNFTFDNDDKRIATVAYTIDCYTDNAVLLKKRFFMLFFDATTQSQNTLYFGPYRLLQSIPLAIY